jgi:F0F1-type ATP synthase membrane subunit b/b'
VLASSAIRLLPDWTLLVQLAVFLAVLASLTFLVIRPTLRLLERRRSFTSEAMEHAAKLASDAEQLEAGRREVLAMALREAQASREQRVAAARRRADKTIAESRVGVAELLQHGTYGIESAEALAEFDLEALSQNLADRIMQRFTE